MGCLVLVIVSLVLGIYTKAWTVGLTIFFGFVLLALFVVLSNDVPGGRLGGYAVLKDGIVQFGSITFTVEKSLAHSEPWRISWIRSCKHGRAILPRARGANNTRCRNISNVGDYPYVDKQM